MIKKTVILCPIFNDSASFHLLLGALVHSFQHLTDYGFTIFVVDDGSTEPLDLPLNYPFPIKVLHLHRNIGHQKALAVGLAYIKDHIECEKVLVMDTDGEDRPEDAVALLHASREKPGILVFAYRATRQEGTKFKLFYKLYRFSFHVLTGRKIPFGNFMVIPRSVMDKIVYYSEIWSHLAGGILKSGISYSAIHTHRGKRYAGKSKMNFTKLLVHGLGAISVFMEVIASRLLIFSFILIAFSLAVILTLLGIRTFTDLAIPGWTSTLISSMLIVLLQSFLLSLVTLFLFFSSETQRKFIPAHHYKDYAGPVENFGA